LAETFVHEIQGMYDAEHQFLDAMQQQLPKTQNPAVQQLLTAHIAQTQQHIGNLEQVFQILGQPAQRMTCDGAAGLVAEGTKLMQETQGVPALLDLAIAGGDDKVEHYEVATYRGLVAGAQAAGQMQIVQLLQQNLLQEEQTAQLIEQSLPQLLQKAKALAPA